MELKTNSSAISKKEVREDLMDFEEILKGIEGAFIGDSETCPLKHTFSDGIYVREIFIPEGTLLVGKIHKHDHPNFLMSGKVKVVTEDGTEVLEAPLSIISKAGTKRALYAITDLVWITIHNNPTNTQDLGKLEEDIIATTYEDYEKYIEDKKEIKTIKS